MELIKKNQQQAGAIYKCLIVCPKSLKEQWQDNVINMYPDKKDWQGAHCND